QSFFFFAYGCREKNRRNMRSLISAGVCSCPSRSREGLEDIQSFARLARSWQQKGARFTIQGAEIPQIRPRFAQVLLVIGRFRVSANAAFPKLSGVFGQAGFEIVAQIGEGHRAEAVE